MQVAVLELLEDLETMLEDDMTLTDDQRAGFVAAVARVKERIE
jgi:hypothetical protein